MKTALVTGGAGFIGSHLSELLLDKKWNVRILVRRGKMHPAYKDIIYPETIDMLKKKGAKIYYGDLRDINSFKDAVKGVDVIFHIAGVAYPYFGLPEQVYFDINTEATKELIKFAEKEKIKRFVYTSSIEAVGPAKNKIALTEESQKNPTDAYGESKKASEEFLLNFAKKNKTEVVIIRPPMTYGERSPLLTRLFRYVKGGIFPMFGKGTAFFEFCYVKNLVNGIYLAGTEKKAAGNIYFISEGSYRVIDVVNAIAKQMNVNLKVVHIPKPIAYVIGFTMELLNKIFPFYPFRGKETGSPIFSRKSVDWITNDKYLCSIDKIKKELGYKPVYSREQGIKNTLKWYESKKLI